MHAAPRGAGQLKERAGTPIHPPAAKAGERFSHAGAGQARIVSSGDKPTLVSQSTFIYIFTPAIRRSDGFSCGTGVPPTGAECTRTRIPAVQFIHERSLHRATESRPHSKTAALVLPTLSAKTVEPGSGSHTRSSPCSLLPVICSRPRRAECILRAARRPDSPPMPERGPHRP